MMVLVETRKQYNSFLESHTMSEILILLRCIIFTYTPVYKCEVRMLILSLRLSVEVAVYYNV